MDILYLLIPLSVVLVIPVAYAFWWALREGQFDDLDSPAQRILMDDDESVMPNCRKLDLDQEMHLSPKYHARSKQGRGAHGLTRNI